MQQPWVRPGCWLIVECVFQHSARFFSRCAWSGCAGLEVPKLPRGSTHQGFGEQARDIQISGIVVVDLTHRISKCIVIGAKVFNIGIIGIANLQGLE